MTSRSPKIIESSPKQNHLLAALPTADFDALAPHLELVSLKLGEKLYRPCGQIQHAYFPTTAIVLLQYLSESGASCAVAGVGNEGVVGVSLVMGGTSTSSSAAVQTTGLAYRLRSNLFKREFNCHGALQQLLLRYTQSLMTQMGQTVVCTRHHPIEKQLCRWLLLTLDRLPTAELLVTQELISNILGVRRESISEAAAKLQRAGIISYCRGHISVLNRAGLEASACECYDIVKREQSRLLSDVS